MPDLEDYMDDETREAIHNDTISDEDYEKANREAEQRYEEELEAEASDPYSQDEKEQMGSSELFFDND